MTSDLIDEGKELIRRGETSVMMSVTEQDGISWKYSVSCVLFTTERRKRQRIEDGENRRRVSLNFLKNFWYWQTHMHLSAQVTLMAINHQIHLSELDEASVCFHGNNSPVCVSGVERALWKPERRLCRQEPEQPWDEGNKLLWVQQGQTWVRKSFFISHLGSRVWTEHCLFLTNRS